MPASPTPLSLRVLVVEDSFVNQLVLTRMLMDQGCQVEVATDGQQGVEQYLQQSFDVVLMDVQMPVMDGLAATRMIRSHEKNLDKRALIVAVTAGVDRESCLQAGMDDYVQKPVRPDVLRAMLEQATSSRLLTET